MTTLTTRPPVTAIMPSIFVVVLSMTPRTEGRSWAPTRLLTPASTAVQVEPSTLTTRRPPLTNLIRPVYRMNPVRPCRVAQHRAAMSATSRGTTTTYKVQTRSRLNRTASATDSIPIRLRTPLGTNWCRKSLTAPYIGPSRQVTMVLQTNGTRTLASAETVLLKLLKWQTRKKKTTSRETVLNFVNTLQRQGPMRGPPLTTTDLTLVVDSRNFCGIH